MIDKFKRWFMCRLIVTYEYDAWIKAGNASSCNWNCDENYILFLKERR